MTSRLSRASSVNTVIAATIKSVKNVIVRNLKLSKVVGGDCTTVQAATNVWLDHLELSGDLSKDKDYYDGLRLEQRTCDPVCRCPFWSRIARWLSSAILAERILI